MTARKTAVERVLVLRTCNADMTSHGGFKWPTSGAVTASDWQPTAECGNGLHGFLWGEGDGSLASWEPNAKWLVVSVAASDVVNLGGKVKFRAGRVVYCGDRLGATSYIAKRAPGRAIIGGVATAGDYGTATAGDGGTATAGYRGTATAGDGGTATAGNYGTATAGYGGTATAGDGGTATAGDGGTLVLRWHVVARYRLAVFYVGDDGIEPNVAYRYENGKAVRA